MSRWTGTFGCGRTRSPNSWRRTARADSAPGSCSARPARWTSGPRPARRDRGRGRAQDLWFHVDGAYGGLFRPARRRFRPALAGWNARFPRPRSAQGMFLPTDGRRAGRDGKAWPSARVRRRQLSQDAVEAERWGPSPAACARAHEALSRLRVLAAPPSSRGGAVQGLPRRSSNSRVHRVLLHGQDRALWVRRWGASRTLFRRAYAVGAGSRRRERIQRALVEETHRDGRIFLSRRRSMGRSGCGWRRSPSARTSIRSTGALEVLAEPWSGSAGHPERWRSRGTRRSSRRRKRRADWRAPARARPPGRALRAGRAPPAAHRAGLGLQYALICLASIVLTPTVMITVAGGSDAYCRGRVRGPPHQRAHDGDPGAQRGRIGARATSSSWGSTSAFLAVSGIPRLEQGGPGMLALLIIASSLIQFVLASRMALLRRIFTPTRVRGAPSSCSSR